MAKRSTWAFRFDEMEALAAKIEAAEGSLEAAVEQALQSTHDFITPKLAAGIARHDFSGATKESLDKVPAVKWVTPLKAQVSIGFDLTAGGVPSIFLMWGTPRRKASEMPVDKAFRNSAFGPAVKREAAKLQREAMEAYLQKITRGRGHEIPID